MSITNLYFICSCCGDKVIRNDSKQANNSNDFMCCYLQDPMANEKGYTKCDNCICILHLESWQVIDSEEDKINHRNLVMKNTLRICCLQRVSLAFLTEQKMFQNYRTKINTYVKQLNDDPYKRNK